MPIDHLLPMPGTDEVDLGRVLSPREVEVIELLAEGRSNKEIGNALSLSEETIKRHVTNLFNKVGASSRTQLGFLWGGRGQGSLLRGQVNLRNNTIIALRAEIAALKAVIERQQDQLRRLIGDEV